MDGARHQFLARPRLARDQDGRVGAGDLFHLLQDPLQRGALAHHLGGGAGGRDLRPEDDILGLELRLQSLHLLQGSPQLLLGLFPLRDIPDHPDPSHGSAIAELRRRSPLFPPGVAAVGSAHAVLGLIDLTPAKQPLHHPIDGISVVAMHPLDPLACGEGAPELAGGKAEVGARVLQHVDPQVVLALEGHLPRVVEGDAQQNAQSCLIPEELLEGLGFRNGGGVHRVNISSRSQHLDRGGQHVDCHAYRVAARCDRSSNFSPRYGESDHGARFLR